VKVTERFGYAPDGSAFSRESIFLPGARLPADLDRFVLSLDTLYYRWIPRFTAGLVEIVTPSPREARGGSGWGAAARVIPFGPIGLRLGPATLRGTRVERRILGGWLVGEESGVLAQELVPRDGGLEAAVSLEGFRPRFFAIPFGREIYDRTQEVIHRRLSRAYLRHDVAPRLLDA
jgi:hypothetical protein